MLGGLGSRLLREQRVNGSEWVQTGSVLVLVRYHAGSETSTVPVLTGSSPGPAGGAVLPPPAHTAACRDGHPENTQNGSEPEHMPTHNHKTRVKGQSDATPAAVSSNTLKQAPLPWDRGVQSAAQGHLGSLH